MKIKVRTLSYVKKVTFPIVLFLVAAIPITIMLTQETQETRQQAAGSCVEGLQAGAPVNNGRILLDDGTLTQISQAGAGWIRINFIMSGYNSWNNSQLIGQYDTIINNARSKGLKVLGLLSNESQNGVRSDWQANSVERGGTDGYNEYIRLYSESAAFLINRYRGQIDTWEIWNEPDLEGTYLYPSNFAQMLARVYPSIRSANARLVNGGIVCALDGSGNITAAHSGGDYLRNVYAKGKSHAGWESIKATHGSYPIDVIGSHIYIDSWRLTSAARINACINVIHSAARDGEGGSTGKRVTITEMGWPTNSNGSGVFVNEQTQAENIRISYQTLKSNSLVENTYWFFLRDESAPNLFFGLLREDWAQKPAYNAYRTYAGAGCVPAPPAPTATPGTLPTNTPQPPLPGATATPTLPPLNQPPTGGLDVIDDQGRAFGHAVDPDIPSAQIQVHFWVDGPEGNGRYAGTVNAAQDFNNGKGPHSYIFIIPNNFRDGQNHTLYAYGLDYQGVTNGHLGGSPKTFNLRDTAPPDPVNPPEPPPPSGNNPRPETNPPPNPKNLRVSCNLPNRTARITWESGGSSPSTDFYTLTVTGTSISNVRVYGTGYTVPIQLGNRYSWWINAVNHTANYAQPNLSGTVAGQDIRCDYPPLPDPPTPRPTAGNNPPPAGQPATIIIRLRNEQQQPVVVNTGGIFVDNLSDSENYNLGGTGVQNKCSKRTAAGEYQCVMYAGNWYAGMNNGSNPSGFCIVNGGIRKDEGDSAVPLAAGGTITADVILRAGNCAQGGTAPTTPSANCLNMQGPTTIRLGQAATYLTQYTALTGNVKAGIGAVKTDATSADPATWSWNPDMVELQDRSASKSFTWTPTAEGTYQLFCRSVSVNNNAECRGSLSTVQSPVSSCTGPGASLVVNVTSQDIEAGSGTDMCSQIVLFGSGTAMTLGAQSGTPGLTPGGSVSVAAVSKPGFNIKTYSFAFYNADNNPTEPKPIHFEAGKHFIIESTSNNINLTWDDLNKADRNFGNRRPTKVHIAAFLTDALGRTSLKSPACIASLDLVTPSPTPNAAAQNPQALEAAAPTAASNAAWIGIGGIVIAIIVVSFYFFIH